MTEPIVHRLSAEADVSGVRSDVPAEMNDLASTTVSVPTERYCAEEIQRRYRRLFSFFLILLTGVLISIPVTAGAQPPASLMPVPKPAAAVPADFVIGPEDVLGIVFWKDQEMTGDLTVRPDGMITLPLIGDLKAAGFRPTELAGTIAKLAGKFLEDVNVTVIVRQINSRKVFITGEVRQPGAYNLTGPRTVMQLIALAGGLSEFADGENITIMRDENGQARTLKFNYRDVSKGKNLTQNIEVEPGDTIVVP